jgi:ArsR family transcriptional regulator, lead/cadmium/zinc/bismuth-responsive transcriptional repressor
MSAPVTMLSAMSVTTSNARTPISRPNHGFGTTSVGIPMSSAVPNAATRATIAVRAVTNDTVPIRDPNVRTVVRTFASLRCVPGRSDETCDLLCLDLPKAEAARRRLPPTDALIAWSRTARALADPTRLVIALALDDAGTACVCDLGWIVGRDERLVSHHVRQLKAAGLATSRRDGKMVMYELTDNGRSLLAAVAREHLEV